MARQFYLCLGLVLWAAGLMGVLSLVAFPFPTELNHAFCGPWGCLPPLEALLAVHGFWFVLMIPISVYLACTWPAGRVLRLSLWLIVAALLGLVVIVAHQAFTWLPSASGQFRRYFPQRVLYVVVTTTDLPLLQLFFAGVLCRLIGRCRCKTAQNRSDSSSTAVSNQETTPANSAEPCSQVPYEPTTETAAVRNPVD